MDNFYLSGIVKEVSHEVIGRAVAKVALVESNLMIDFRLPEKILIASVDPTVSALYLSTRDRKQENINSQQSFATLLRKEIAGARLIAISKKPDDRIVSFEFESYSPGGEITRSSLVLFLTGRTANAYIVDREGKIEMALYERGDLKAGQKMEMIRQESRSLNETVDSVADQLSQEGALDKFFGKESPFGPLLHKEFIFRCGQTTPAEALKSLLRDLHEAPPTPLIYSRLPLEEIGDHAISLKTDLLLSSIELAHARQMLRYEFGALSEAAEKYYRAREMAKAFQEEYAALRRLIATEFKKREAALRAIESDRARFEDPDRLRRYGDLILANLATAARDGGTIKVTDYYDPEQREIEIPLDENKTPQQAAADYFSRYQKARRAQAAIASREAGIAPVVAALGNLLKTLEARPTAETVATVRARAELLLGIKARHESGGPADKKLRKKSEKESGRRFVSTEGYEIVVGRNDKENDQITFRVARPMDLWLHAADYPGSHVVVKNPRRETIPHRTLVEAAEIAAFYSQAKKEAKVAVHYTQKKFVSKPPRAHPGLVRLASFKTILVEPRCAVDRLE